MIELSNTPAFDPIYERLNLYKQLDLLETKRGGNQ